MARSEPYACETFRCPLIPGELPDHDRIEMHIMLSNGKTCGFKGKRASPVLARIAGEITNITRSPELTIITVISQVGTKDHKVPAMDEVLGYIKPGKEVIYGEPLSYGIPRVFCRLQAWWAFTVRIQNGNGKLAYEKIAAITGVPKSSVFQSERIGIDLLKKKIGPFIENLKTQVDEEELVGG